eukprot:43968_1
MADKMFEGEESMDHFVEKYCSENSADKCKTTTIGYIRNLTKACDKFTKLTIPMEITNIIFAFYFGIKCSINLRYYAKLRTMLTNNYCCYYTEYKIIVPITASLHDIWIEIQNKLNITDKQIRLPVFTLFTTSPRDYPDIIYFNKDNFQFYSKPNYAKFFYHKINPIARWRSCDAPINHNTLLYTNYNNTNNNQTFIGDPILCIENWEHLPQQNNNTIATQQWYEPTNFSTIYIDDYTQINHAKKDKQYNKIIYIYNNIGSSNIKNTKLRKLILKIPKGISLETFYKIARQKCNISNQMDIRAFRLYANEKYLITFQYKFQLKEHKIMLEIGRYPKYTE